MERVFSSGLSSVLRGGADTVVAPASTPARCALAVVRLSGGGLAGIIDQVCPGLDLSRPWRAQLVEVRGSDGETLEVAVATPYSAPRSYTGEDMVELVVHGSPYLVGRVMDACVAAGARLAEPGEFSRRAVANGKMDLVQAEGIRDLIAAETAWQLRSAREQVDGGLSKRFAEVRERLVGYLAALEVVLEFSEQNSGVGNDELWGMRAGCLEVVERLLATARAGRRVRDGMRVVIAGPPNCGKSTLFNLLLEQERAIVSPRPGTTRDVLEAEIEVDGLRACLVDTAGLREGEDEVEAEGVERARGAIGGADVVLLLSAGESKGQISVTEVPDGAEVVAVRSKADLADGEGRRKKDGRLWVSAVTGEGVTEVRGRLEDAVRRSVAEADDGVAIAQRHRLGLERAAAELAASDPTEPELAAENARWALEELRLLTGEVESEAVLDEVFRRFCIGK